MLQSLGLQRVGHTQGLNKNHCPALVGDLNLQRRGCVIQVSVTCPAQSLTLPLRTTWKAALPEAGAPPGEQPCASPDLIRPEAVIHVSVNRLGLSRGCMLSCC